MSQLEVKKNAVLEFSGAIAAPATPFDSKGNLNVTQIDSYASYLLENGATGFFIFGTTGELYSLTLKEKIAVVQAWRKALDRLQEQEGRRFVSIVNVSSTCVPETHELVKEVERLDYDGIALLPPLYYQDPSADHLVAYLKHIVDKSSGKTPLLYYHNIMASFNGILKFDFEDFLAKAIERIPQFAAVKWGDPDGIRYARVLLRFGNQLNILAGFDEQLLMATALGGKSAVTVGFNVRGYPRRYLALLDAFKQNNLEKARQIQQEFIHKRDQMKRKGGPFLKALKQELNAENAGKFYLGNPREPIVINDDKSV